MNMALGAVRAVRTPRILGLLAALTAFAVSTALSQDDPRLRGAIQLAQKGRQDSARAVVARLLATVPTSDSLYPEALYTAGILAAESKSITRNLERVVVEYGYSPWADDALLRLAQFYYAQGDHASAVQTVERLRRDYPDSPLRGRAGFWGARSYFQLSDEAQGCVLIGEAVSGAGTDVEFKNQAEFYAGRCPGAPAVGATGGPDSIRRPPPAESGGFAVQVLAVRNAQQVDEMLTRLKVMGFPAHVVRDSTGFFKVRVGPYAERAEADRTRARLRTRLGGQPFVVEEP